MAEVKKIQLLKIIDELEKVNNYILKNGEIPEGLDLAAYQELAVKCGNAMEIKYAASTIKPVIEKLEELCEVIYQISLLDIKDKNSLRKLSKKAKQILFKVKNSVKYELPEDKKIMLFLPYKSSMWDSLESIWLAANKNENIETLVIPIPYFDRNPDGTVGTGHYEGEFFPSYVPVVDWRKYKIPDERPDYIFIHYPYDENNFVTMVHPDYFSDELKKYTDKLIYVPYFILPGTYNDEFALTKAVIYSDYSIVQNEITRQKYIKTLKEYNGDFSKVNWENRIIALGSPKTDKVVKICSQEEKTPEEWEKIIDGRKVILLNTNVSLVLNNDDKFIDNLNRMFEIFVRHKEQYAVIWREHPLTMPTIESMRPHLKESYLEIQKEFKEKKIGVLDFTPDPYSAIRRSDCYFGSGGSLLVVYGATGKPMMVTDYNYPKGISEKPVDLDFVKKTRTKKMYAKETSVNSLDIFLDNLNSFVDMKDDQLEKVNGISINIDGTVGEKILDFVLKH